MAPSWPSVRSSAVPGSFADCRLRPCAYAARSARRRQRAAAAASFHRSAARTNGQHALSGSIEHRTYNTHPCKPSLAAEPSLQSQQYTPYPACSKRRSRRMQQHAEGIWAFFQALCCLIYMTPMTSEEGLARVHVSSVACSLKLLRTCSCGSVQWRDSSASTSRRKAPVTGYCPCPRSTPLRRSRQGIIVSPSDRSLSPNIASFMASERSATLLPTSARVLPGSTVATAASACRQEPAATAKSRLGGQSSEHC